jgi:hypothetical protein
MLLGIQWTCPNLDVVIVWGKSGQSAKFKINHPFVDFLNNNRCRFRDMEMGAIWPFVVAQTIGWLVSTNLSVSLCYLSPAFKNTFFNSSTSPSCLSPKLFVLSEQGGVESPCYTNNCHVDIPNLSRGELNANQTPHRKSILPESNTLDRDIPTQNPLLLCHLLCQY